MAQDLSGLQAALQAMEGRLAAAIAKSEANVREELGRELGQIRHALDELHRNVKYLVDNLLAETERAALKRAAGRR